MATKPSKSKKTESPDIDKFKALSHPIRFQALHIFNRRVASPNQIARAVGKHVNLVSYHVRVLEKYGCIELVDTKPVRGANEHFYRATTRAVITDEEWVQIPTNFKDDIVAEQTKATGQAITEAMASGAFNARNDRRQTWITMIVDEQGWTRAMAILARAETELIENEAASLERLPKGNKGIPLAASIMGFEMALSGS